MNLIRKGHGHKHRGVIGIESAIVLIAFVIVAAALAFVVLNMGFSTTQKAKTAIVATLGEAGSSLEIQGKVFAWADTAIPDVQVIGIPIKIASGGDSVNLAEGFSSVKFVSNDANYDDIYEGVVTPAAVYFQIESAATAAAGAFGGAPGRLCDDNPILGGNTLSETCAFVYFTVNINNNEILDAGEHAVLALMFTVGNDSPDPLDKIKVELIPPSGATLTLERQIPNLSTDYVDLG
jgi:archaeal flagellin FlaB